VIKRLEKEDELRKKLPAEKEIEGHLKTEMLKKKVCMGEKKEQPNEQVVEQIINLQDDPDTNYGYRKM